MQAAATRPGERGRGAVSNPDARYLHEQREAVDDGWATDPAPPRRATTVTPEQPRTIISRNRSPDIPFEQSINPYRGCEHGCIYCYARPTHAYLDLSPGLDFETRLFAKPNAAALLRRELARPGYRRRTIALGTNTDPYQPIERHWRITRQLLEVLAEHEHPLTITTKSRLVLRDIDLLAPLAAKGLAKVYVSVTTLDHQLARRLEPRATAPGARLQVLAGLAAAGVSCGVMFAPVIPALNDGELEAVLQAAAARGARRAGYLVLRLPHELRQLFEEWLSHHYPQRAARVLAILRALRGGRDNDPRFNSRMSGTGVYARLLQRRFRLACDRLGLNRAADSAVPPPAVAAPPPRPATGRRQAAAATAPDQYRLPLG